MKQILTAFIINTFIHIIKVNVYQKYQNIAVMVDLFKYLEFITISTSQYYNIDSRINNNRNLMSRNTYLYLY